MSKYIIFYPSDLDMKDEPKETVLWEVKYKLHDSILGLPDILTNLLKQEMTKTYPLSFWHNEFVNMNMQLIYDYIYAKEYAYFVDNIPVFTATVTALDLNRFNNEVVLKQKIAKKILKDMKLKYNGSMHPEKFHKKMYTLVDLSEEEFISEETMADAVINLEYLCEKCLQYESPIEWKTIC